MSLGRVLATLPLMGLMSAAALAQTAHFVIEGHLVSVGEAAPATQALAVEADEVFGELADGRLVIGVIEEEPGEHVVNPPMALRIVGSGGEQTIATDVVRAYPEPGGERVVFIDSIRDSHLWDGRAMTRLPIERRASQFAWFPDGRSLAVTTFDPDWTVEGQTNADTYEDFLRLNNNDIHRFDLNTGELSPLVIHPEADWAPVIAPDGRAMVFNSTRLNSRASVFRLDLATGEVTPLSVPDPTAGFEGNLPVPFVNQTVWKGDRLIYATSRPDGVHEIRSVGVDGSAPRVLGEGTRPQLITGGQALAFLGESDELQAVELGEGD